MQNKAKIWIFTTILSISFTIVACKKETAVDAVKVKPPVRTYLVTARIDKKGTNSNSEGTAVLKGKYEEDTKVLSYSIEYQNLTPVSITLRSGHKGSVGTLVKELNKSEDERQIPEIVAGTMLLNPLQERNLLKGQWFIAINTMTMTPEITGILTLKQQ